MRVALFGSTGFVGSYLVKELIKNSYDLNLLVRDKSKVIDKKSKLISGDISSAQAVKQTIEDADVIIYNIGIIREFPNEGIDFVDLHHKGVKLCVSLAKKLKINRFILMSANGVKAKGTKYQTTKYLAEKELIKTSLDWTIFRPSLIFGQPLSHLHQEFCTQLKNTMLSLPLPAPLFYEGIFPSNAGDFLMSPIHVKNVAQFFSKSISDNNTIGKIYNLGGTKQISWREIIHLIATASGKSTLKLPAPVELVKLVASIFDKFRWFPVTRDQLLMLLEGNVVEEQHFSAFEIDEIEFNKSSLSYLMK